MLEIWLDRSFLNDIQYIWGDNEVKFTSLYDPNILKKAALEQPLQVFLCGPGFDSHRFNFREKIRNFLHQYPNVSAVLGEELDPTKHRLKPGDLQTVEATYAHSVDFTILLLESFGSIAELGSFSMMPDLRPRLFVMVPGRFFSSESYIARGPLRVHQRAHASAISFSVEQIGS